SPAAQGAVETRPERLLPSSTTGEPAPSGQPYTFDIGGTPTYQMGSEGTRIPIQREVGNKIVETPSPERGLYNVKPPSEMKRTPQRTQYLTGTRVRGDMPWEQPPEGATGGVTLHSVDPKQAQATLDGLNQLVEGPQYAKLPVEQRIEIQRQIGELTDDLETYNNPYPGRGGPHGAQMAHGSEQEMRGRIGKLEPFREASDEIKQVAKPIFDRANAAANGEMQRLTDQYERARDVLRNGATSPEQYEQALISKREASEGI